MTEETIERLFDMDDDFRCGHENECGWVCELAVDHRGKHMVRPGYSSQNIPYDMWDDEGNPYPPGPVSDKTHKIKIEPKGEDW